MPSSTARLVLLICALILACDDPGSQRHATEDTVAIPYRPMWVLVPPLRPTGREGTLEDFESSKWLSSYLWQQTIVIDSAAFSVQPNPLTYLRGADSQVNVVGCESWLDAERYWMWITGDGRVVEVSVLNGETPVLRHGTLDVSFVRQVFSLADGAGLWSHGNHYRESSSYVFGHNPHVMLFRVGERAQKVIGLEEATELRTTDGDTSLVDVGFRKVPSALWSLYVVLHEHVRENVTWQDSATSGRAVFWGGDG